MFNETKSKNKKKIQEVFNNFTDATEAEEVIKEIEKVIEENNIDKRIFNGKKAEEKFCEFLTNEQVWQLIVECYTQFVNKKITCSSVFARFLKAFAFAFYKELYQREGTWDGKTSLLHRFTESKLGTKLSFGVRALQKGIAAIRDNINGRIKDCIDSWKNKFEIKMKSIISLIDQIRGYLSERIPNMMLEIAD